MEDVTVRAVHLPIITILEVEVVTLDIQHDQTLLHQALELLHILETNLIIIIIGLIEAGVIIIRAILLGIEAVVADLQGIDRLHLEQTRIVEVVVADEVGLIKEVVQAEVDVNINSHKKNQNSI